MAEVNRTVEVLRVTNSFCESHPWMVTGSLADIIWPGDYMAGNNEAEAFVARHLEAVGETVGYGDEVRFKADSESGQFFMYARSHNDALWLRDFIVKIVDNLFEARRQVESGTHL